MQTEYEAVIGMEVHIESNTQSKMFCSCVNDKGLEETPNVNICPICTGHPGTLPVPNREALVKLARFGKALKCSIAEYTWFERKSYFYPDLPKGYQITQFERPLCYDGSIQYMTSQGEKTVRITRIHMEEDTARLSHRPGTSESIVDFNRAGLPLMELVTEPDIRTAEEARVFCEELQLILRYLDISDANMDKGQMRCEVNISLRPKGSETFGTKVEIKNLNSFKVVEGAIHYEIERQSELLDNGGEVVQETRGWDDVKGVTVSQRKKENANDYRYFIEPDIPPFETSEIIKDADQIRVELPFAKRKRFREQYHISDQYINTLVNNKVLAEYFENCVSELLRYYRDDIGDSIAEDDPQFLILIQLASNYLLTELVRLYQERSLRFESSPITPENYAEYIMLIKKQVISSTGAQTLLVHMVDTGGEPDELVEKLGLTQMSDQSELQSFVDQAIIENPDIVTKYKEGNDKVIQFLVGQVMKMSKGKANPQVARELLENSIG